MPVYLKVLVCSWSEMRPLKGEGGGQACRRPGSAVIPHTHTLTPNGSTTIHTRTGEDGE